MRLLWLFNLRWRVQDFLRFLLLKLYLLLYLRFRLRFNLFFWFFDRLLYFFLNNFLFLFWFLFRNWILYLFFCLNYFWFMLNNFWCLNLFSFDLTVLFWWWKLGWLFWTVKFIVSLMPFDWWLGSEIKFALQKLSYPNWYGFSIRKISKISFRKNLHIITVNFKRTNLFSTHFYDCDISTLNLFFYGFFTFMSNVFICLFIMTSTPLMRFTIWADFNENLCLSRRHW